MGQTTTDTGFDSHDEQLWQTLYPRLRSLARYLVNTLRIPYWLGQEEDLVEDIVQETLRRTIEHIRKAERGEKTPIHSLNRMITVIAYNYARDLRRHDRHTVHLPFSPEAPEPASTRMEERSHPLEKVTEQVYQEQLFTQIAQEVKQFPLKQRTALLVDLANRMAFEEQPSLLQKIFQHQGIELRHYQRTLPTQQRERSRHVSSLSHAYKRLAHLSSLRNYT